VELPSYDRKASTPSIVHFGVGGFHRSHMAVYVDDMLQEGVCDWTIIGVGLKDPYDRWMRDALKSQDCYYTVLERYGDETKARVIGSLVDCLFAPENPEAVLQRMSRPEVRIVSLTITEGGYYLDSGRGTFQSNHPDVEHDRAHQQTNPKTVFGYIIEALRRRHRAGIEPFTVLSCDNLQSNGDVTRHTTLGFAAELCKEEPELFEWIQQRVAFPNSMVDRITPQTTDEDRKFIQTQLHLEDKWPVVTEPFRQWIIEDNFCPGSRPPLHLVGAQFVKDVAPYEAMKLRILNAGHSSLAYLGYLAGHRLVHHVARDSLFVQLLEQVMDREVTDLLPPVPGIDLADYKRTILNRFSNSAIQDRVTRLCSHGSAKVPKFVLPSISEHLERFGTVPKGLALVVAGWLRFLEGTDERGEEIPIEDDMAETLRESLRPGDGQLPERIFGELARNESFVEEVKLMQSRLRLQGVREMLKEVLQQ